MTPRGWPLLAATPRNREAGAHSAVMRHAETTQFAVFPVLRIAIVVYLQHTTRSEHSARGYFARA